MSLVYRLQLIFLFQLLIAIYLVFALPAPYTNETVQELDTPLGNITFQPEPTGRGTVGILISCTATYIFCVWTAVHPNINVKTSAGSRLLYKVVHMVLSIIVPEALLVCAFGQLREAKKLKKEWDEEMRRRLQDPQGESSETEKELEDRLRKMQGQLGMDGAFFVVMGGFLIDTIKTDQNNNIEMEPLENPHPSALRTGSDSKGKTYIATLTPAGFLEYLRLGYINETSFDKCDIKDKAKANNIAKLLAFVQALWLIIQSCARWGSHLRVTLLEIHVLIQVFCTTFIFYCWWSKPLDVDEPITIKLVRTLGSTDPPDLHQQAELDKQIALSETYEKKKLFITKEPCHDEITVSTKAYFDLLTYVYSDETGDVSSQEANDVSGGGKEKKRTDGLITMVVEGSLIVMVGGLHLTAWNVHFPSQLESYLWKGCSFGVIVFPSVIIFITSFTRYERDLFVALWEAHLGGIKDGRRIDFTLKKIQGGCKRRSGRAKVGSWRYVGLMVCHYFLMCTCLLALLMYALCTIYIVLESYISMRDLPKGVFLTPKWSDYWPHL